MSNAIQMRGATQKGQLIRTLQDQAAAAGLPGNVVNQRMLAASTEANRGIEEALAANEQNNLARKAQLLGMMPPEPQDNTGAMLLGTGIQAMASGAFDKNPQIIDTGTKTVQGINPLQKSALPVNPAPAIGIGGNSFGNPLRINPLGLDAGTGRSYLSPSIGGGPAVLSNQPGVKQVFNPMSALKTPMPGKAGVGLSGFNVLPNPSSREFDPWLQNLLLSLGISAR
jgi:hypothetical protein